MAERRLGREQILAFRARRHGLAERAPAAALRDVAAIVGVQDTPPGTAAVALAARLDLDGPPDTSALLLTWSLRGAPHLLPVSDHAVFTLGALPAEGTRSTLWRQPEDALVAVEALMVDALRSGPRTKGEVSAAVAAAAPDLAPFCRPCDAHHPNESVFRGAALLGRIVLRSTAPVVLARARPAAKGVVAAMRSELLRRHLRAYAPTTPGHFAQWAGITGADAKQRWSSVADAVVKAGTGFVLAEDLDALERPEPVTGVRLVPNKDAFLQARDRDVLFLDAAARKAVFPMLGGPGVVLVDAEPVATWRGAAKGKRFEVTVEPFGTLPRRRRDELGAEADRVTRARGLQALTLVVSS